jgi:hypothetical protein
MFFRTVVMVGAFYKGFISVVVSSFTVRSLMSPTGRQAVMLRVLNASWWQQPVVPV